MFFLVDMQEPSEMEEAIRLNRRMVERAIAMDGTCTGEHGVGVGKKVLPRRGQGAWASRGCRLTHLHPAGIPCPGARRAQPGRYAAAEARTGP